MTDSLTPSPIESHPLPAELVREAMDSPIHYIGVIHRYLDGGLSGLGAPAQRVFLQLVRLSLARGLKPIRITVRQLAEKTGLSKDTISVALRHLASPEVDLVNVVSHGGPHIPGHYEVRWFTYEKRLTSPAPIRRRLRSTGIQGSIESRIADLHPDDKAKVEQVYVSLQPHERRPLEDQVSLKLQDLGIMVDKKTFHQFVLHEVMKTMMPHHIRSHYPTAFSYSPIASDSNRPISRNDSPKRETEQS